MAFTRRAISGYGLTNEQLEKVMALHAASLAGYVPKSEVREQINLALAGALENAQVEEFFDLNSENPAPVQKSGEKMPISKVFITIEYV